MPITLKDLTSVQVDALRKQGFDPSKYSPDTVLEDAEPSGDGKMNVARAAYSPVEAHAGALAGSGLGGLAGMGIGAALAPETGGLSLAIPLLVGLLGSAGGSYTGEKAQESIVPAEAQQELERRAQQAYEEHPYVARGTELGIGALLDGGRPSFRNLSYALGRNADNLAPEALASTARTARANVLTGNAINTGAQAGLSAATQLYDTGSVDPKELGKSALEGFATGALFSNPSWLGKTFNPRWHSVEDHIAALKESTAEPEMLDDQSPKHDEILAGTQETANSVLDGWKYKLLEQARSGQANDSQVNDFTRVKGLVDNASAILNPKIIPDSLMLKNFKKLYKKVSSSDDFTDQANSLAFNNKLNGMSNEQKRQMLYQNQLSNIHSDSAAAVKDYMTQSDSYVNQWKSMLDQQKITQEQLEAHQTELQKQQEFTRDYIQGQTEHAQKIEQGAQKLETEKQKTQTQRERNLQLVEEGRQKTALEEAKNTGLVSKERIAKTNIAHTLVKNQIAAGGESREGEGTASKLPANAQGFEEDLSRTPEEEIQDKMEDSGAKYKPVTDENQIPVPERLTPEQQQFSSLHDWFNSTYKDKGYELYDDGQLQVPVTPSYENSYRTSEHINPKDTSKLVSKLGSMDAVNKLRQFINLHNTIDFKPADSLDKHIQSGKATTGSVLDYFAASDGHPYQRLANELLVSSHPESLAVPWELGVERSHFNSETGKVMVDEGTPRRAGEILEEAIHSLQTTKIPRILLIKQGKDWYDEAQNYIKNNPGDSISELIEAYIETVKQVGLHDTLFSQKGLTGSADRLMAMHQDSHVAYALGDFAEFLAHAYRTKDFQELLNHIPSGKNDNRNMWQRIVDAIKHMFGISPKAGSMLEHVIRHTAELHSREPIKYLTVKPDSNKPTFIGHQSDLTGKTDGFDLYNLKKPILDENGKVLHSEGSTVSKGTLDKYGVKYAPLHPAEEGQDPLSRGMRSVFGAAIDKIHNLPVKEGKTVANAFTKTLAEKQELQGKWWTKIDHVTRALSQKQRDNLNHVLQSENRDKRSYSTALRSQPERKAYDTIRSTLKEIQQHQIAINEPVMRNGIPSKPIHDPWYYPTTEDLKAGDTLRQGTDIGKIQHYHDAFVKNYQSFHPTMNANQVEQEWRDFVDVHQGSPASNSLPDLAHFGAMRKQAGTPLPAEMRRNDPAENMFHYVRRSAMDMSHYKNVEADHAVLGALNGKTDAWGNPVPPAQTPIHGNEAVKAVLDEIRGEVEPYSERAAKATEGLASAAILGLQTEIHKVAASPFQAATFSDNPAQFIGAMTHAVSNLGRSYLHAEQNGLSVKNPQQIKRFTDSNVTVAEKINLVAKALRSVYTLGGLTERLQLGLAQGTSEYLVGRKIDSANNGQETAMSTMIQLDPDWVQGKTYTPEEQTKLASRMAGYLTGTRDARTMPTWMLRDTEISSFFKLMSWNVAQTNSFMKNAWLPMTKGDIRPLIMTTFGATLGGYLIKELRERASGRPSQIASLADIQASSRGVEGNIPAVAYNWMAAASFGGLGGMISLAAKVPFDIAYRNHPQGMVFPLDEYATNYAEIAVHVADALAHDPTANVLQVAGHAMNDIILKNTQLGRTVMNQMINAGVISDSSSTETGRDLAYGREMSDAATRLKHFQQVEGLPLPPLDPSQANPYLNEEAKRFKHTEDIPEAVDKLKTILGDYMAKYAHSPDILMSKIEGLKANPLNIFPSMENAPIVFSKYIQFLTKEYGPSQAQALLGDYLKRKVINQAKGQMVP